MAASPRLWRQRTGNVNEALRLERAEKYMKTNMERLYSLMKREPLSIDVEEVGSQTTKTSIVVFVVSRVEV